MNSEELRDLSSSTNITSSVSTVKPTRCINVSYLFNWSNTLHVSDGLSIRHQELRTVHTATGICQTDTASKQTAVSV
jgi:hypothetical protein